MNTKELLHFLRMSKMKLNMKWYAKHYHLIITCALEAACDSGYTDEMNQLAKNMHIDWDQDLDCYPTDNLSTEESKQFLKNLIKVIEKE